MCKMMVWGGRGMMLNLLLGSKNPLIDKLVEFSEV